MEIFTAVLNAIIIIIVFSILIIVHELGHFLVARRARIKIERFAIGFGKKILGVKKGETEYVINMIPLGGYVKLAGEDPYDRKGAPDEFYSKAPGIRFWVLSAGSIANYIFAFFVLIIVYMSAGMISSDVGSILKGSPAELAGIMAGDKIVSIDGKKMKYWDDILTAIRADKTCAPLKINMIREGRPVDIEVIPTIITTENVFKQKMSLVRIGIAPSQKIEMLKGDIIEAVRLSAMHVYFFTKDTYKGLWFIITGAMPLKDNVGGPIMIIQILNESIKYGFISVLNILATISLALAIFNMLPFPVLDGGHILFLIFEKIRKKPLSVKTQEIISQTAVILLIALVIYVSYFDTMRVITNIRK